MSTISGWIVAVYVLDAILLCVLINLILALRAERRGAQGGAQGGAKGGAQGGVSVREQTRRRTLRMVLTAMFLSFALALKYFTSVSIPLFGANGMRISFGGIFTAFPAILFGPFYGGLASAMSDFLGYFIKPSGDYNPLFTLVAFLGGFIKGALWLGLRKCWGPRSARTVKIVFTALMVGILALGICTAVSLQRDGVTQSLIATADRVADKETVHTILEGGAAWPTRMMARLVESKKSTYQSNLALYSNMGGIGFICVAALGLAALGIDRILAVRHAHRGLSGERDDTYLRVLLCILLSGLVVTTINTAVIMDLYGIQVPFLLYWIPRVLEEIIVCTVQAYFIALLYKSVYAGKNAIGHKSP